MTKQTIKYLPLFTISFLACLIFIRQVHANNPTILITEVQPGYIDDQGTESAKAEFIELSNVSGSHVDLTGWKLDYLSAANSGSTPGLTIDNLGGQLAANGRGLWVHEGYYPVLPDNIFGFGDVSSSGFLAKSGGHVRLMHGTTMVDCVAWGSAVSITGCDKVNTSPAAGFTVQRQLTANGYDKNAGVINLSPGTPMSGNIYSLSAVPPNLPPFALPINQTPQPDCSNVELSEILANPTGDDAANEFIEIHNLSSQNQSLFGCQIKLSNGKQYQFPQEVELLPNQYKAFTYQQTGLQLSNSGASVTLVTSSGEVGTTYPIVGDDESWVFISGLWQISSIPTPNAVNSKIVGSSTISPSIMDTTVTEPCPVGKFRNLETGRCKNLAEVSVGLTVCSVDQERNPDTGRCRKRVITTVAACAPDQERNPQTGRCKKIDLTATAKPCEPDQERNPDTGRCRKKATTSSSKVLGEVTSKKTYHIVLIAVILGLVFGYAIYEYRGDIAAQFRKIKKWLPSR
ncbi:MAG: lamin tail domain-containing protein [Candidatus Saccharimonadales bacterium]